MSRTASAVAVVCALLGTAAAGSAQEPASPRKQARAIRANPEAITLDGRLDEAVWQSAQAISDFVQKEPVEGQRPSDVTEIRFVFDDTALYIGARLAGTRHRIQAPMTRRDDADQAEHLLIDLDTYLDRRTSYTFGVTASGVRIDRYHASDNEGDYDSNFDPVWQARTHLDADGWTAELWLPFSQLRFNARDELVWGLNVTRWIPSIEERDYWVAIPRTERAWSSRFGELRGVTSVRAPRRLEFLPYVASSSRVAGGTRDRSNPFETAANLEGRFGLDMKVGLGSNLTLEATVNPDFGQIDADPAEVNLSVFETFFNERRPFFLEGSGLISNQSNLFYSRRIGARPSGSVSGDYVDYPETATILGAAKLTGRARSGASIGILGAVTGEESARTETAGVRGSVRVAPRTVYGAGRFQQELGSTGSVVGFQMTAMHRDLSDSDPLAQVLVRSAFSGGADALLRFGGGAYESRLFAGGALIEGEPAAIERRQRSSVHYFHRPDAPAGRFDPARGSLGGGRFQASLNKIEGRHWLWGADLNADSPELDTNDSGRLNDAGDINVGGYLTFRETEPSRWLRSYNIDFNANRLGDFDTSLGGRVFVSTSLNVTWPNFWSSFIRTGRDIPGQDLRLTRGGPSMETPRRWEVMTETSNSQANTVRWTGFAFYSAGEIPGDVYQDYNVNLSARPVPQLQLSLRPDYSREVQSRQYVTTLEGGRAETFGNRYVFGTIDRSTLSAQARVSYTFKPDLNLDLYAEPFAASGRYNGFGELLAPRSRTLLRYGSNGTTLEQLADGSYRVTDGDSSFALDSGAFNVRSFRSNVVLRWEWRPGSTAFLIWQQNRSDTRTNGDHVGPSDLFGSFSAPGDNILAFKMTLWLSR